MAEDTRLKKEVFKSEIKNIGPFEIEFYINGQEVIDRVKVQTQKAIAEAK